MLGLLPVDKPGGCTSHDVVARIRRALGRERVGHAGTLDPMATGLLVCGIGQATRLLDYVQSGRKTYDATMRLGMRTDTQDVTGTIEEARGDVRVTAAALEAAAAGLRGRIRQVPPLYSAVKRDGVPLHRRIRRGQACEPPPAREVEIYRLDIVDVTGTDVRFSVECSSGTYVRTLCHDWGAALDVGGCLAGLRRTQVGPFSVAEAGALDALRSRESIRERLQPVDRIFEGWPRKVCTPEEVEAARAGRPLPADAWPPGTTVCLTLAGGGIFALATATAHEDSTILKAAPVLTQMLECEENVPS